MENKNIIDINQNFQIVIDGKHSHRSGSYFQAPIMYLWAKQIKAKNILEIGIGAGSTAYWLGHAAKENGGKYYALEYVQGRVDAISKLMDQYEIPNKIQQMDTKKLWGVFFEDFLGKGKKFDLIFLDGNHTKEVIEHEMKCVYPWVLKKIGYIFIHDIHTSSYEGWLSVTKNTNYDIEHLQLFGNSGLGIIRKIS